MLVVVAVFVNLASSNGLDGLYNVFLGCDVVLLAPETIVELVIGVLLQCWDGTDGSARIEVNGPVGATFGVCSRRRFLVGLLAMGRDLFHAGLYDDGARRAGRGATTVAVAGGTRSCVVRARG